MTVSESPRRLRHLPRVEVRAHEVPAAVDLPSRLFGLSFLRAERAGAGLFIPGCRSVHTFGMRFPLDLVFLDAELRTVSSRRRVPPNRIVSDRRARAVLELPAAGAGR